MEVRSTWWSSRRRWTGTRKNASSSSGSSPRKRNDQHSADIEPEFVPHNLRMGKGDALGVILRAKKRRLVLAAKAKAVALRAKKRKLALTAK